MPPRAGQETPDERRAGRFKVPGTRRRPIGWEGDPIVSDQKPGEGVDRLPTRRDSAETYPCITLDAAGRVRPPQPLGGVSERGLEAIGDFYVEGHDAPEYIYHKERTAAILAFVKRVGRLPCECPDDHRTRQWFPNDPVLQITEQPTRELILGAARVDYNNGEEVAEYIKKHPAVGLAPTLTSIVRQLQRLRQTTVIDAADVQAQAARSARSVSSAEEKRNKRSLPTHKKSPPHKKPVRAPSQSPPPTAVVAAAAAAAAAPAPAPK